MFLNFVSKQFSSSLRFLLIVISKVLVSIEIEVKLPKVRNNLLKQINPQCDCIVSKNTCFQRILMGNREKRRK